VSVASVAEQTRGEPAYGEEQSSHTRCYWAAQRRRERDSGFRNLKDVRHSFARSRLQLRGAQFIVASLNAGSSISSISSMHQAGPLS
jgi:hypothetical protein